MVTVVAVLAVAMAAGAVIQGSIGRRLRQRDRPFRFISMKMEVPGSS